MRVMKAGFKIMRPQRMDEQSRAAIYGAIEEVARKCYKSEDAMDAGSAEKMCRMLVKNGHEAMLEHASITVCFFVDRGVTHEMVRHRIASFAQESTRYCNYSKGKFGNTVTYIDIRNGMRRDASVQKLGAETQMVIYQEWISACADAEMHYMRMLDMGASPQIARSVLSKSTKSELVVTRNVREWRHLFRLRALGEPGKPHPQMQEVALPLLETLAEFLPALFSDLMPAEQKEVDAHG